MLETQFSEKIVNFIMILKPDAIERGLFGKILIRFEEAGFSIVNIRYGAFSKKQWKAHYDDHRDKPFFKDLVDRMCNRNVAVLCLCAQDGIKRARRMIGCTNALEAQPGTIRGDYGSTTTILADNLIHVSDCIGSAEDEVNVWFGGKNGK